MNKNPESKLDLVLIQGFPANQSLSAGVIEYMNEYFNVYFINFPGFHKVNPPIENLSFEKLCQNIENEIEKLNLDNYILAGISMGFLIANSIKIDESKVLAIMGLAPFLGKDYLQMGSFKKTSRRALLNVNKQLRVGEKMWEQKMFKKFLSSILSKEKGTLIEIIVDECQPQSFFGTAQIVMSLNYTPNFKNVPYIVLINEQDETIKAKETIEVYKKNIAKEKLYMIYTDLPHYPKDTSYEYLKQKITSEYFEKVYSFLNGTTVYGIK